MTIKIVLLSCLSLLVILLPSRLKIPIYRHVFGYRIGKHVKIGLSWIKVGQLEIGNHVVICHFVRFKNVPEVKIGDYCTIGFGTTFTSTSEFTNERSIANRGNRPALIIGDHCGIALLHYFDVQDTFTIGSYTTIAGRGSIFITHYLEVISGTQSTKPISIGKYCMVGSSVRFAPGSSVAEYSVVGMAAIVTKQFDEPYVLIGGNPAVVIRHIPKEAIYFKRLRGWIGTYSDPPW